MSSDINHEFGEHRLHIIEWEHLDLRKFYPLALASSWSIRCMLYPMSVVKARLQLQKRNTVYRGMYDAVSRIICKEGVAALYRGYWMTLPQLSASFIYSSMYEKICDLIRVNTEISSPSITSALAGAAASTGAQFIFIPTDIVAQHMMIYNNPKNFIGSTRNAAELYYTKPSDNRRCWSIGFQVTRSIYRADGLKGFYRGSLASLMLYIPSSAVFWMCYYKFLALFKLIRKHVIHPTKSKFIEGVNLNCDYDERKHYRNIFIDQALAGSCSGICAAVCTNWLEVFRIRLQVQRISYYETLERLQRQEGLRVFTKGLAPRVINNGIYSCLIMLGYETVKKTCVLPEYKDKIIW